jgi:hypothetical protein
MPFEEIHLFFSEFDLLVSIVKKIIFVFIQEVSLVVDVVSP